MRELEQLKSIIDRLESIQTRSTAGTLADLSEWLERDATQMRGLIDSAMQYTNEILEYNAEVFRREQQERLHFELAAAVEESICGPK